MESEFVTPSWLDKDFLTSLLQEDDLSKSINILSYSAKPAVAPGNNYSCIVLRVSVEYEINSHYMQTSLIIKTPFQSGEAKIMIEEMGLVTKENLIYNEILPLVTKMTNKEIAPKTLSCSVPGTIILQDMKEKSYIMCDRLKQLDFDHCYIFMKTIAVFHATTLHIHNQKPELIAKVGKDLFFNENPRPELKEHFTKGIVNFASVLEHWGGFEHFVEFFRNNDELLWNKAVEISHHKEHLKVLNHGDVWTNNMLFKHDETGKVIDMKLIDFQVTKFASPALDIISFLLTSAQEEVKRTKLPDLYTAYLDSFNYTLEAIGSEERLSLKELHDELKYAEMLPLCLISIYLPIVLCEKENVIETEQFKEVYENLDVGGQMWNILNGAVFKEAAINALNKIKKDGVLLKL